MNKLFKLVLWALVVAMAPSLFAQADLSITATASSLTPAAFTNQSGNVTITNSGPQAATNVVMTVIINPNPGTVVFQGANPGTVSQGTVSGGGFTWTVGTLAAGQTATWSANIFTLATTPFTMLFQVQSCSTTDPDSQPGNATMAATQDDEKLLSFNGSTPPPTQPNLIVQSSSLAASATSGGTMSNAVVVRNNGNAAAAASTLRVYLSANNAFDGNDIILTSSTYSALAANTQQSKTFNIPIPAGISGTRWIIFRADDNVAVNESNENDNILIKSVNFTVGTAKPDLVVTGTPVTPVTLTVGANYAFSVKMRNQGTAVSGQSKTGVYLSNDGVWDNADIDMGSPDIQVLGVNTSTANISINGIVPNVSAGNKFLLFISDFNGVINESNENNNVNVRPVTVIGQLPDLVLQGSEPYINAYVSTANIQTLHTLMNIGTGDAMGAFSNYYVSSNAQLDASDQLIITTSTFDVPAQVSVDGQYYTVPTPQQWLAGGFYLIGKADPNNLVAESDETNNTSAVYVAANLYIPNTLYAMANSPYPYTFSPGDSINMLMQGANDGNWQLPGDTVNIKYYLSTDEVLNTATDTYLGGADAATNTYSWLTKTPTFNLPSTLTNGTYYVIANMDALNEVPELDENNAQAFPFTITTASVPKVKVMSLSIPSTVPYGVSFTAQAVIKNFGTTAATGGSVDVLINSAAPEYNGSFVIGQTTLPTLAAGQSTTVSVTVTIPAQSLSATLFLGFNVSGVVGEINWLDNYLAKPILAVNQDPDLIVSALNVSPGTTPGTLQATGTIKNIGILNAPASVARWNVYENLSSVSWPIGVVTFPDVNIPQLNGGQSHTFNVTLTPEQGLLTGEHRIELVANSNSAFTEVATNNNARADTTLYNAVPVTYNYYNFGGGAEGRDIRRLSNGNFQIIAKKETAGFKIVTTNGSMTQLSTFDIVDSVVVFGNNDGFLGMSIAANYLSMGVKSYSASGSTVWTKNIASPNATPYNATNYHATRTTTGYAIVTTVTGDTLAGGPNFFGTAKAWVANLNEQGNQIWSTYISTPGMIRIGQQIIQLANGNLQVALFYVNQMGYNKGFETVDLSIADASQVGTNGITGGSLDYLYLDMQKLKPASTGANSFFVANTVFYGKWSTNNSALSNKLGVGGFIAGNYYAGGVGGAFSLHLQNFAATGTSSGGALTTGIFRVGENLYQTTLFKYAADGTTVARYRGPGAMKDILQVNSNLYALTGANGTQLTVVFVDSVGMPANAPGGGGGGGTNAYDLALSMSVSNPAPAVYNNVTFTATLSNQGTQPMNNIVVSMPLPTGIAYVSHTAAVGGTYDSWLGNWSVPTLAAGQSITLQVVLFTLNTTQKTVYAQVKSCSNADADSTPNNGTPNTPNEDDEAKASIYGSGLIANEDSYKAEMLLSAAFPNPSRGTVFIDFDMAEAAELQCRLADPNGKTLNTWSESVIAGKQTLQFDFPELPSGSYYLTIETPTGLQRSRLVLIQR